MQSLHREYLFFRLPEKRLPENHKTPKSSAFGVFLLRILVNDLPITQYFPPNTANQAENNEIDHAHYEACFPPFTHCGVA